MSKVLGVPAEELVNLEKYHAFLKVDTLPAVKIRTLEPPQSHDEITKKVIENSMKKYGAKIIESINPFDLFLSESEPATDNSILYDSI